MEPNTTRAAEVHEVEPLFDLLDDGVGVLGRAPTFDDMFRWMLCPVLVDKCIPQHFILPNLHNRLQKLLSQFAGGLEVFLDSEDGEVTIKRVLPRHYAFGASVGTICFPSMNSSTVSWTFLKHCSQGLKGQARALDVISIMHARDSEK